MKAKTVNNRLLYTGATTTDADSTSLITHSSFIVEKGTPVGIFVSGVTAPGTATYHTSVYLQGSIDNVSWVTLQTIKMDSGDGDITATNGVAFKQHLPATYGDFPYYRVANQSEHASNEWVSTITVLIG